MGTVYSIAFRGDRFLMVFNEHRDGWEMPGGRIEDGESIEDAAKREFLEESGYDIEVIETRDLGDCHVCAAVLLERSSPGSEMVSELFSVVPKKLYFDLDEYDVMIPWARSVVLRHLDQ